MQYTIVWQDDLLSIAVAFYNNVQDNTIRRYDAFGRRMTQRNTVRAN